jgi:signal transduction histidine kinase
VNAERDLVARTARRLAIQAAALFSVAMLAVTGTAGALIVHSQDVDAQRALSQALRDEDVATDPSSAIVVYREERGRIESSSSLSGPLDEEAVALVRAGGGPDSREIRRDGREYLVHTARHDGAVVQVGLDLTDQHRSRVRLLEGLALAAATGLVLASILGWLIARRAMVPLGQAFQRQQQFVADASHELRTPLTQVHTRAQLLQRSVSDLPSAEVRDDADRLVRGTRLLGEIVDDLLVSAQLGAEPRRREPVDLRALAEEVVRAEDGRAAAARIALSVKADAGPHTVGGSPTALRRVLTSLVDNAFGHTSAGGNIALRVRRDAGVIEVAVVDDGEGFADNDQARLFERFARGTHGGGRRFGLGLALVREVVQAHGGTVAATGRPGQGASFVVRIPALGERHTG